MKMFFTLLALIAFPLLVNPLLVNAQGPNGQGNGKVSAKANQGDAQFNLVHPDIQVPPQPGQEDAEPVTVMGVEVQPMSGLFAVVRDVNVRKGPATDFKRVAGLKAGERVRAVGKPKGAAWIAVSKEGEIIGFVFAKMLAPVVDGALEKQFIGSFASKDGNSGGVVCEYRFRFERKVKVEGADFFTADYEVRFRCASSKGASIFYAHMFLTEAPVNGRKGLHLIGLDVRSIGDGLEKYLTTRFTYNPKTGEVQFKGHSLPRFATPPTVQKFQTTSIKEALQKALEASIASWTPKAWESLFSKTQKVTQ